MARILLVEDDVDVRTVIERALTDHGHQVAAASDCAAAVEVMLGVELDLVITDVSLPDGSGRRLAQAAASRNIPTLYITGDFAHMTALEAEGAFLLRKPFRLQELRDAVAELIPGGTGAPP